MRRGIVSGSLILVGVLVLGACSSSGGNSDGNDAGDDGVETLQDFIPGAVGFDPDNAEEQYRNQEQQAQEMIADCMAAEGFEYVPYVQNTDESFSGGADTAEEYAELYGFGVTHDLLSLETYDENEVPPELVDDPNYAIQEGLSDEERDAYNSALYGDQPDIDFESMTEDEIDEYFQSWDPGGCQNEAYESVFDAEGSQAFYDQFGDEMQSIYERAQEDPRIADLEANWSACMAESGYDFENQQDATIFIARRLEEIGAIQDLEVDPNGNGWGYGSEGIEPGSEMYKAAKKILDEEIEIAVASVACQTDTEDVYQQVYSEYEQDFIEQHRAELEQFKEENS